MGVSIREKEKGSGVFWVFVRHRGRRISRRVGDLKAARKAKALIEAELIRNPDLVFQKAEPEEAAEPRPKPAPVSFKTYSLIWLEDYIRAVRRRNTYERYKQLLRDYIDPIIGKQDITAVNRGHIKSLLLDLNKRGFSASHICLTKDVISGVFNYAFDEELVEKNPCNHILKHLDLERDKTGDIRPLRS